MGGKVREEEGDRRRRRMASSTYVQFLPPSLRRRGCLQLLCCSENENFQSLLFAEKRREERGLRLGERGEGGKEEDKKEMKVCWHG